MDLDSWPDELIVGTRNGVHTSRAEAHLKADAVLTSVVAVSPGLAMVFYDRGHKPGAAVYRQDLHTIPGMTFYDVIGGTKMHGVDSQVCVFTSAALRLIKLDPDASPKARVLRTTELKGAVKAVASLEPDMLLVATQSEYLLVNAMSSKKVPLFPILNGLAPEMACAGPDFLVVQGTSKDEPAMGLFVDSKGEVARNGKIIEWDTYPTSLVIWRNTVFAVCQGRLVMHAIVEKGSDTMIENMEAGQQVEKIFYLNFALSFVHKELLKRLGSAELAREATNVVFLGSTQDEGAERADSVEDGKSPPIELYKPEVPQLVTVEQEILNGSTEIPPFPASEAGRAQQLYLQALLVLHSLDIESPETADLWKAVHTPCDIILYIYGHSDERPKVFPGLVPLVAKLRSRAGLDREFFKLFLRSEIRRLRKQNDQEMLKILEPLYARYLEPQLVIRFLLERGQTSTPEILATLRANHEFDALRSYYELTNQPDKIAELNLEVLSDPQANVNDVAEAAQRLATYSVAHHDWDIAIQLLTNARVDDSVGIGVLTSRAFEEFDPAEILAVLKQHTDSGPPWRAFLKHLVHTRGLFRDDLVSLLAADLIAELEAGSLVALCESYSNFAALKWPKPTYQNWVRRTEYPAKLLRIQSDMWDLMSSQDLDWGSLMATFDALPELKIERAMIYTRLRLLNQALSLLNEITDFASILDYPSRFEGEVQKDVTQLTFRIVLESQDRVLSDFMSSKYARHLDVAQVLDSLIDSRPFHVVAPFFQDRVREQEEQERRAQERYAVAKSCASHFAE